MITALTTAAQDPLNFPAEKIEFLKTHALQQNSAPKLSANDIASATQPDEANPAAHVFYLASNRDRIKGRTPERALADAKAFIARFDKGQKDGQLNHAEQKAALNRLKTENEKLRAEVQVCVQEHRGSIASENATLRECIYNSGLIETALNALK